MNNKIKIIIGILAFIDIVAIVLTFLLPNDKSYTISFNTNGGSIVSTQKVKKGEKVIQPVNPIKEGYTFKEWQLNGLTYSFNDVVKDNMTLDAIWVKNKDSYTVSFNANGGSSNLESREVKVGASYGDLPVISRDGYKFAGWFKSSDSNFDYKYYADTYDDLKNAFGYDEELLLNHWIYTGIIEGRKCASDNITKSDIVNGDITIYAGWIEIIDIALFWGQSNMVGAMEGNQTNNTNNLKGIDSDIINHNVSYSRVTVDIPKNVAFDYLALSNTLVDISTNPATIGENLQYVNGKIVQTNFGMQSQGTNMVPYFAKEYYEKTHHKLVAVHVAKGGCFLSEFMPNTSLYNLMVTKFRMAEDYLKSKNDKYIIGNRFYVVYQGESDINDYTNYEYKYLKVHSSLMKDLKLSFGAMIYVVLGNISNPTTDPNTLNFRNVQAKIVSNNSSIIKGSDFPFTQLSVNNKSILCPANNRIHLNSAALSQVGREVARSIYNSGKIK